MIRYATLPDGTPITLKSLRDTILADATGHLDPKIRAAVAGWLAKSDERTAQLLAAGDYIDLKKWRRLPQAEMAKIPKPIDLDWSIVKYLFMKIQNEKCAYCERKLASRKNSGAAEHDLEHFRPKNPVEAWSSPKTINFVTGDPGTGYFWLAYHLLNYSTACKKCNSGFKSNYFPIAGKRFQPPDEPTSRTNKVERPYLIYPLGIVDDDPEMLIRFRGITAHPPREDPLLAKTRRSDPHRNRRASVTIEFFGLNHRDELLWGRAEKLRELEKSLALINSGTEDQKRDAKDDIRRLVDGYSEHTACVRAMIRLYQSNPKTAQDFFEAIRAYLDSKTPEDYFKRAGRFVKKTSPAR